MRLRSSPRRPARGRQPRPFTWVRRIVAVLLLAVAADALYLFVLWPDWEALATGTIPKSNFINAYETARADDARLPPLRWKPVALARIAPIMRRVVVISEDGRFWLHEGIDTEAIADAMETNLERGRMVYGGSTISQQTTKNLFLTGTRDPLRKWHELVLTVAMERNLRKSRILELYLNVAEFGTGVFGVEAAARHYFGVSAAQLTSAQAIALAASLPSPKLHNPATDTRAFEKRKQRIARHLAAFSRGSEQTPRPLLTGNNPALNDRASPEVPKNPEKTESVESSGDAGPANTAPENPAVSPEVSDVQPAAESPV